MTPENAFLEDIEKQPLDDVPRLIYADWLQDQDDPVRAARGEFIRAQIESERLLAQNDTGTEWAALTARALELQQQYQWRWLGKVCSRQIRWVFRRGFLAALGEEVLWDEADSTYRYLARFYDDGRVVSDSSSDSLANLWDTFHRHNSALGIGPYSLWWTPRAVQVSFNSLNGTGLVEYKGTIVGRTMRLKWYSHINQNHGTEVYRLQVRK